MSGKHRAPVPDEGAGPASDGVVPVDEELRLRPYAGEPDVAVAVAWYSDPTTVALVDGPGAALYDAPRVAAMYATLATQGEVLMIERRTTAGWAPVGDVTLAPETLPIVVAPEHRRQGIGRRVVLRLVDRARVLGWRELQVRRVEPANKASRALFTGVGFVSTGAPPPAYVLRLSPLGGRTRH